MVEPRDSWTGFNPLFVKYINHFMFGESGVFSIFPWKYNISKALLNYCKKVWQLNKKDNRVEENTEVC